MGRRPTGRSGSAQSDRWKRQFGERVRELRGERGLSQEQLAHASGVHRTYAGAVERGEQNISLTNMHQLADALGVRVADLFPD